VNGSYAQFGVTGDPDVAEDFEDATIPDDPAV
jgi:hypothetical protein